ncbi:MAG: bifunctional DNA-formamidopyrimidine glycosylase/DNA-(apurinic or apyrimidinic site) lyase [Candidatus Doudnabacteria bacterium]
MDKMVKVGPGRISNIKSGTKSLSQVFARILKDKKIMDLDRRAKYLIIKLSDNLNLMIHLRMSGQLIYIEKRKLKNSMKLSMAKSAIKQTLPVKHTHVEFVLQNGDRLFYNDPRQFGHIRLVNSAELAEVLNEHNFGPEPLTLEFTEFNNIVQRHSGKRAKDFLLNQEVIAGIGNIYADEALFISKISPLKKVGLLKEAQRRLLLLSIKKILNDAIKSGGSSVENFLMSNGSSGSYSNKHLVYAKAGQPCPSCGKLLKSQKIGSRTATFCTNCQRYRK